MEIQPKMSEYEERIRHFLQQLKEPYRTQALNNIDPAYFGHYTCRVESISDALDNAFCWFDSLEGSAYWEELWYQIRRREEA